MNRNLLEIPDDACSDIIKIMNPICEEMNMEFIEDKKGTPERSESWAIKIGVRCNLYNPHGPPEDYIIKRLVKWSKAITSEHLLNMTYFEGWGTANVIFSRRVNLPY